MEKKKILFIAQHLTVGGVQKSLLSLLSIIDYDRYDVTLYIRKNRTTLLSKVDKRCEVIVNDDKTHYYIFPKTLLLRLSGNKSKVEESVRKKRRKNEVKRHFGGRRFDAAVCYVQGYTADILPDVPADRKILVWHSSVDECHDLHERLFPETDDIVTVSDRCREILAELYPAHEKKISCICNYIDAESVRALANETVTVKAPPEGKTVLCTCGRVTRVKGYDLALEAASELKKQGFDFVWYFVGDGDQRQKIAEEADCLGLHDEIVMTGMLENPYPYIGLCDIYVQPSYEESYGITIAEAMLLSKPVVSTETEGGIEQITDGVNGVLTQISAGSLAEGIKRLIGSPKLMGEIKTALDSVDHTKEKEEIKARWEELFSADRVEIESAQSARW